MKHVTKSRRRKRPCVQAKEHFENIIDILEPKKKNKKKNTLLLLEQLRHREVCGGGLVVMRQHQHKNIGMRRIAFQELQTPPTEAILGLDETGSHVIGIEARQEQLQLVKRAVPSANRQQQGRTKDSGAPLMQRILLPCEGLSDGDSLVATIPIDILLSGSDVGVVRIQTHQSSPDDGEQDDSVCVGTMILCNLATGQTSTCPNVRLGGGAGMTIRNLLWKVHAVPIIAPDDNDDVDDYGNNQQSSSQHWFCRQAKKTPAHLLLNDEDDGYRLTWVVAHDYHYHNGIHPVRCSSTVKTKPVTRHDIVIKETTWQRQGGANADESSNNSTTNMIACEAYLSIEALLDDIRARRKEVFYYEEHIPGFFYNLVSVDESGRYLTVAMCFSNRAHRQPQKRPSSIAVLVQVDIYTQSYQEIEWAQHGFYPNPVRLQNWSEQFALNRRMKDMRVGPFSVGTGITESSSRDWRFLLTDDSNNATCRLKNSGSANCADCNSSDVWREFARLDPKQQQKRFCKTIPMAALYPDCDLLNNAAVRREIPVQVLQCRNGTTELFYGAL